MAKLPFALQLHSVRGPLQEDFRATLARVKAIGYDYVETVGLLGHSSGAFAAALSDAGLTAISAHVACEDSQAALNRIIDQCVTLGVSWGVMPWLSADFHRCATDWVARATNLSNTTGRPCWTSSLSALRQNARPCNSKLDGITMRVPIHWPSENATEAGFP